MWWLPGIKLGDRRSWRAISAPWWGFVALCLLATGATALIVHLANAGLDGDRLATSPYTHSSARPERAATPSATVSDAPSSAPTSATTAEPETPSNRVANDAAATPAPIPPANNAPAAGPLSTGPSANPSASVESIDPATQPGVPASEPGQVEPQPPTRDHLSGNTTVQDSSGTSPAPSSPQPSKP